MNQIIMTVVLPLLAAFVLPVVGRTSVTLARLLGLATVLITATISWLVACQLFNLNSGPFVFTLGGFPVDMGITYYVDQVAALFVLLVSLMAALLWPFDHRATPRHYSLILLLVAGCSALAMSADIFNIYVFYELVSVASFGLAASQRSNAAFAATLRYLVLSGAGTVMALTGIALLYTQTGTLSLVQLTALHGDALTGPLGLASFLLILLGVGVKAELFPVNMWVPEVYATTSSRTAALLAGVVSKLAVLVVIRMLVTVFPFPEAMQLMLLLGVIGVIAGELAAWRSRDMTRMLAFSSIGQLGMVFIAFAIPGEMGLMAGFALALHHLLVKPGLFLLAERWGGAIADLQGAARPAFGGSLLAGVLFVLFALSLVGVPPFPGFWAKLMLIKGLVVQAEAIYSAALVIFLIATVIEANYLFRLAVQLFARPNVPSIASSIGRHGFLELGGAALLAAVLITALVFITPVGDTLQGMVAQFANVPLYVTSQAPLVAGMP